MAIAKSDTPHLNQDEGDMAKAESPRPKYSNKSFSGSSQEKPARKNYRLHPMYSLVKAMCRNML